MTVEKSSETLLGQLPQYFRPILEFQEILKAHGYGLDQMNSILAHLQSNFYISTCDEPTIAYYEKLLGIRGRFGDTLDFRRERVIQKLNTVVPFSIGFLKDRLTELYGIDGYTMNINPMESTLNIKVTSDRYGAIDLLYDLLWDVVPAHIKIIANQQIINSVPGRLYAAGGMSSAFVQTIYRHTVSDIEGEANVGGGMSSTIIKTV